MTKLRSFACAVLSLALLTATSFAAAHHFNNPRGIAVDAAGNLWVANTDGGATGNILTFNAAYALQKTKTITQNVDFPNSLAFDAGGYLWVSNFGNGTVVQYANGVPTGRLVTGIQQPWQIAMDGIGNLYVLSYQQNISIYGSLEVEGALQGPIATISQYAPYNAVGVSGGIVEIAWPGGGGTGQLQYYSALSLLTTGMPCQPFPACFGSAGLSATPVAFANAGENSFYMASTNGFIELFQPAAQNFNVVTFVTYQVTAMAADVLRQRLYVADAADNTIYVYSTVNGALLKTIQ